MGGICYANNKRNNSVIQNGPGPQKPMQLQAQNYYLEQDKQIEFNPELIGYYQNLLQELSISKESLQNKNQELQKICSQQFQLIQSLQYEISKANLKINKTLTTLYSQAQKQNQDNEKKIIILESEIRELNEQIQNNYKIKEKFEEDFLQTEKTLKLKEIDYNTLSKENQELKETIKQKKDKFNQKTEQTENINEQKISELNKKIEEYEKEKLKYIQIDQQNKIQIDTQNNKIEKLTKQINDNSKERDINIKKFQGQSFNQKQIEDKQTENDELKLKIYNLEYNERVLNRKIQETKSEQDRSLKEAERELNKINEKLKLAEQNQLEQKQNFEIQIKALNQNLIEQQKVNNMFEQYKNENKNNMIIEIKSISDKLTSIRSRLQMIFALKSHEEQKIQNLIDESKKKLAPQLLSGFENYENGNINEIEVQIFKVEWDQDQISKLIEDKNFYELYKKSTNTCLGSYKGNLTMSSVGENQLQQIKLFKVTDNGQNKVSLKNSVFGLIQNKTLDSQIINVNDATQLVTNSTICDYYLQKFINECKKKNLHPTQNFQIGKQYIIKNNDNQFFQAEILSDYTLVEYLGGPIQIINDFMAAFSYFTYIQSNNELLISYLASIGHIIYNPYVCTKDGILSQVDLGVTEISNISEKIEKNQKLLGKYIALFNI